MRCPLQLSKRVLFLGYIALCNIIVGSALPRQRVPVNARAHPPRAHLLPPPAPALHTRRQRRFSAARVARRIKSPLHADRARPQLASRLTRALPRRPRPLPRPRIHPDAATHDPAAHASSPATSLRVASAPLVFAATSGSAHASLRCPVSSRRRSCATPRRQLRRLLVPHRAATPPRPYSRASPPLRRPLGPAAAALSGPSRVPRRARRDSTRPPPRAPMPRKPTAPASATLRVAASARAQTQLPRRPVPIALPPRTQPPWSVQRRAQSSCCANGRLAQRRRERPTSTGLGVAAPTQAAQRTSRSARLVHTSPQNRVPGPRAVYGATQRARPPLRSCPATRRVGLPAPRARPPARRFCGSRAGHEARGTADPASRDGLDARGVRTNAGGAPTQRRGAPRLERAMYPAGSRAASPPSAFHARRRRELQSAADSKTWAPLVPRRLSVDAARRVTDARWAPRFAPSRGGAAAPRESAPLFARGAGRAAAA
ncbi:hypothetical protein B0H15DRAFT_945093 [Mycena belliarum]|uniref:Uncharacterized protein n=1 Tax=Mycena belliarum TaxID=1033014 RepID=A0AAD6UD30_9AGAR|nr:hypothetical protein B0H15DRAFT_945093 [Mycena belliae]